MKPNDTTHADCEKDIEGLNKEIATLKIEIEEKDDIIIEKNAEVEDGKYYVERQVELFDDLIRTSENDGMTLEDLLCEIRGFKSKDSDYEVIDSLFALLGSLITEPEKKLRQLKK